MAKIWETQIVLAATPVRNNKNFIDYRNSKGDKTKIIQPETLAMGVRVRNELLELIKQKWYV